MCLLGWDSRGRPIFGNHLRNTLLANRIFMFPAFYNSKDRPPFDPSYRISEDWTLYQVGGPTYGSGYGGGRRPPSRRPIPNRRPIRRPWALRSLEDNQAILTRQDEGDDDVEDDQGGDRRGEDQSGLEWLMVQAEDGEKRFWASSELRNEAQSKMEELKDVLKIHLGFDVDGEDPQWNCAQDRFVEILDKLDTLDRMLNNRN